MKDVEWKGTQHFLKNRIITFKNHWRISSTQRILGALMYSKEISSGVGKLKSWDISLIKNRDSPGNRKKKERKKKEKKRELVLIW